MLYISYKHGPDFQWHIDTKLEDAHVTALKEHAMMATAIQADGDELDFIRDNFKNLRDCRGNSVVKWVGEDAQFIATNMLF